MFPSPEKKERTETRRDLPQVSRPSLPPEYYINSIVYSIGSRDRSLFRLLSVVGSCALALSVAGWRFGAVGAVVSLRLGALSLSLCVCVCVVCGLKGVAEMWYKCSSSCDVVV
ncbi:hypothetical protein B0T18DRAFT_102775 [Schizothecium vesticola]|uniref:Uncharacterized protein n=1 Tax=Schizothecium vesticola TaxID=314040 RepID=A0AA40K7Y4_9PEZI|nr:hypothetical protein B0T18DRAFT_102775 [Schizothecium vesticola]